jgi:transposase
MSTEDRERAVNLMTQGFTYRFIAREYGVHPSTIIRLCEKFADTGTVARRPGSGGKRKTSPKMDMLIVRQVKKDGKTCARQIKADLGLENITERTITRRLSESGEFENGWAKKMPWLSEKNRLYRLEWCGTLLTWKP